MATEVAYLYLVLASAISNWSQLRQDSVALKAFAVGWVGLAMFAASLAADYVR